MISYFNFPQRSFNHGSFTYSPNIRIISFTEIIIIRVRDIYERVHRKSK
jgi:hypothetical protein